MSAPQPTVHQAQDGALGLLLTLLILRLVIVFGWPDEGSGRV